MASKVMVAGALVASAANNTLSSAGDWNVSANRALGVLGSGDGNLTIINNARTAIIQSGTSATMVRSLTGNGTLEVKDSLAYDWSTGLQLGGWVGNKGTVNVLGGTVNSSSVRRDLYLGTANSPLKERSVSKLRVWVDATHGDKQARIYEIRAYEV